jgi:hypothetical protein
MGFHEVPWNSMRFYDVLVNRSVPTEANRGLTSYTSNSPPKAGLRPKPKRGALQLQGGGNGVGPPPKASRTRTIRAPKQYSE